VLRVVIDPGVLIAALISPQGAPRPLLHAWIEGAFELLISPKLIAELEGVLERDKFRRYVTVRDARAYVALLRRFATMAPDTKLTSRLSPDPGDDYLIALATAQATASLISGDPHLTGLKNPAAPVLTPRAFLDRLEAGNK
jgi:putative PIN family toxin of toxin-antitoxin system